MKKAIIILMILSVQIFSAHVCHAGLFDSIIKIFTSSQQKESNGNTIISALKEAISIGTNNAIKSVSVQDGYLGNQAIKI